MLFIVVILNFKKVKSYIDMEGLKRKIYFLVSSKTSIGVIESQVILLGNFIENNYNIDVIYVFVGDSIEFDTLSILENREFHILNKTIRINQIKESLVYIRTADLFFKFGFQLRLKKNEIIYDFRALAFKESYYRNKKLSNKIVLYFMEMASYLFANRICAVSNVLKDKLYKFFIIKREVFVFPCISINTNNKEVSLRVHENLDNVIKFVYLGGLSEWQMFDRIVDLYKEFSKEYLGKSTFTIITKQSDLARQKINKKNVKAEILSLTHSEVLEILPEFDFGFLIRKKSIINEVSSPIKLLEYISSGVLPIMSDGIGDYSCEIRLNDIGIVMDQKETISISEIIRLYNDKLVYNRMNKFYENYFLEKRIKQHPLIS